MKLATLKDGSRDGQLIVVSRDLRQAVIADAIAPTLQRALDDWNFVAPQLDDLYRALGQGRARHAFPFDPERCAAPLPRAFQWVDGSAYLNHVALVRQSRGATMPPSAQTDPLMYQGGSDDFLGPRDDARFGSPDWGIDFEAELAVVTDDVPMGTPAPECVARIRLLMLVNDWSLRNLATDELAKGFGFVTAKPATAFGPVAVTPDELGAGWSEGRVHASMTVHWNGHRVCKAAAGEEMAFGFGELIAHLVRTRNARAGTIVGSGTVSNAEAARGFACIAEQRARETIATGQASTDFMALGDRVRIEALDAAGESIFGAIEQQVVGTGH
jgi:fumarylacetoacetate (FAA) hydrolase